MKRAVATITVYVYGNNDDEIAKNSKNICELINSIKGESSAEIEELRNAKPGIIGKQKEISCNL